MSRPIGAARFTRLSRRSMLLLGALAAALVCLGPVAAPAAAAQGDLDPSFDSDGKVITDPHPTVPGDKQAQGVAVQPDGKVVAVGQDLDPRSYFGYLVRYNRDGSLDQSFGNGGRVTTPESFYFEALQVALQRDGKIVVTGAGYDEADEARYGLAVLRYNGDGSLDTSFGDGDGIVVADIPRPFPEGSGDFITQGYDVAIDPDGKIVAAGIATSIVFGSYTHAAAIARFTADGKRDLTFGSGGQETVPIGESSGFEGDIGLALQPDGKSVLATTAFPRGGSADFLAARFTTRGERDPTFDGDGVAITNFRTFSEGDVSFGSTDHASDVALQPDGKIIAVGYSGRQGAAFETPTRDFALARYNADGSLDQGFDGDGKVVSDAGGTDFAEAVALQRDGKIVAGGYNASEFVPAEGRFTRGDFVLFRYTPSGALDPGFGAAGKVITPFGPDLDGAKDLAIQPDDGKIVAAGFTRLASSGVDAFFSDFALARYEGEPPATPCRPPAGTSEGVTCESRPGGGLQLTGTAGNDTIVGTDQDDVILGGGGDDLIVAVGGDDAVSGGAGYDRVNGGPGNDGIDGGSGNDRLAGSTGNDYIVGGSGDDVIAGNEGRDVLRGGFGNDTLFGNEDNDVINGEAGNDRMAGNSGHDRGYGAGGDDLVIGNSGNDLVVGNDGRDRLNGNEGNDVVNGEAGNDSLAGSSGRDRMSGGTGNDRASGGTGEDAIRGGVGNDVLSGNENDDVISGDAGDDSLFGGPGRDRLGGGPGRDRVVQ